MSENPETPEQGIIPEPVPESKPGSKKWPDFWMGLIGSFAGNILLGGAFTLLSSIAILPISSIPDSDTSNTIAQIFYISMLVMPWVVNIGMLIFILVKRRYYIVLGMLVSYAFVLLAIACLGAMCFSMEGNF